MVYCPFHSNSHTPALGINYQTGRWTCFNDSCGQYGDLYDLLRLTKGLNYFESHRLIKKFEQTVEETLDELLLPEAPPDYIEFPSEPLDRMHEDLWKSRKALEYMHNRGFQADAMDYFHVGYSEKRDMVIFPMYNPEGMPVGFVARSLTGKEFRNTVGLPRSKTLWNFQNARRHSTIITVESCTDAMRSWQAGYENVAAILGGAYTKHHRDQLGRTANTIVHATDFDLMYPPNCRKCKSYKSCTGHMPGRETARRIIASLPGKEHRWAAYDESCVFPHGAKDLAALTDVEAGQALRNSIGDLEYTLWNIEPVAN